MKTGTLKFYGKDWRLIMEDGRTITVPSHYLIPKELDNATVQYNNTGGPINTIQYDGVEISKKQSQPVTPKVGNQSNQAMGGGPKKLEIGKKSVDSATAPYNFIPLPSKIVPAPESKVDFSSYGNDLLNGYIDLHIEAKTDLFIRGELEKFFSIADRPSIPGSSMRGLVRSMVELVSFSKMSFTERNRRYFYRNISDDHYLNQFISRRYREPIKLKSKAAYLVKDGSKYWLHPIDIVYRVDMNKLHPNFNRGVNDQNRCHSQVDVWYDPATVEQNRPKNNLLLEYNLLSELHLRGNGTLHKGVLLRTGPFGRKKHYQWVFPEFMKALKPIDVTHIMDLYETDESRDLSANIIELSRSGKPVPCFYLLGNKGQPQYIGHTGIFRIPYTQTIGDCIPKQDEGSIDLAESIFGKIDQNDKSQRSGKVFFEDCGCKDINPQTIFSPLKILSSPKPTSYQLYLELNGNQCVNWDGENARIRGQKMYWHRVGMGWQIDDMAVRVQPRDQLVNAALVDKNTQYTVAEVITKGAVFSGRVRFENLHPVELGALLAALHLPSECAHKIGMGKPYGMGSIRIEPKVYLIDRAKRYTSMFTKALDGENKLTEEAVMTGVDMHLQEFVRHIKAHFGLNVDDKKDWYELLKKHDRLKELYAMLKLHPIADNQLWSSKTNYMPLSGFKQRGILKRPTEHL
jgi:CRISPR-associated protein (TIGR03986 family)